MSWALVTDQKPSSCGYSVILSVQCTGHSRRSCLKVSWGGPSCQSSRSVTRRSFRGFASIDMRRCSYSEAGGMPKSLSVLTVRQILLVCVCALILLPNAATARVWHANVVSVDDGDTIHVRLGGQVETVRFSSIQAMEQAVYSPHPSKRRGECHALEATARLE